MLNFGIEEWVAIVDTIVGEGQGRVRRIDPLSMSMFFFDISGCISIILKIGNMKSKNPLMQH